MDKNKYSNKLNEIAVECAKELISIFKENNLHVIELKVGENIDSEIYINIIGDNFGGNVEIALDRLEMYPGNGNPYISLSGLNVDGERFSAVIEDCGGDYFDVEHSIGRIYEAVVEIVEADNELKKKWKKLVY